MTQAADDEGAATQVSEGPAGLRGAIGRWYRRNRIKLAVIGGLVLAVLVAAGVGAWRLVSAERDAERRWAKAEADRAAAEELLGFVLSDTHERALPLGRPDLLGDAAGRARDYLERHPAGALPEQQHRRAVLHCSLAAVQHDGGDSPGAVKSYREGQAMLERIVALPTVSPEWRDALAACRSQAARVLTDRNDLPAARQDLDAALAIWTPLAAAEPASERWQLSLARARDQLGSLSRRQGDMDAAFEQYTLAFGHAETARAAPGAPRLAADIRGNIGRILLTRKDYKGALAQFGASLALHEELAKTDPRDLRLQRDLAATHGLLATTRKSDGDRKGALREARSGLAIMERLSAQDPTDSALAYEVAKARAGVGDLELATGDARGALDQHRAALTLYEKLFAQDPANADWAASVAFSRLSNAAALAKLGDAEAAQRMLDAADAAHASLPPNRRNEKDWSDAVATLTETIAKLIAKK